MCFGTGAIARAQSWGAVGWVFLPGGLSHTKEMVKWQKVNKRCLAIRRTTHHAKTHKKQTLKIKTQWRARCSHEAHFHCYYGCCLLQNLIGFVFFPIAAAGPLPGRYLCLPRLTVLPFDFPLPLRRPSQCCGLEVTKSDPVETLPDGHCHFPDPTARAPICQSARSKPKSGPEPSQAQRHNDGCIARTGSPALRGGK